MLFSREELEAPARDARATRDALEAELKLLSRKHARSRTITDMSERPLFGGAKQGSIFESAPIVPVARKGQSLTIERSGEFTAITSGQFHCGTEAVQAIRYQLSVTAEFEGALDHRGFFFDQLGAHEYFLNIGTVSVSCERLVHECARGIWKLVRTENPAARITEISLTLSPAPYGAKVRYNWAEVD